MNLGFSGKCPWDSFDDRVLAVVTRAWCPPKSGCWTKLLSHCSFTCGRKFSAFMDECGELFTVVIVETETGQHKVGMKPNHDFAKQCQNLDPRSLVTAAYTGAATASWISTSNATTARRTVTHRARAAPTAASPSAATASMTKARRATTGSAARPSAQVHHQVRHQM